MRTYLQTGTAGLTKDCLRPMGVALHERVHSNNWQRRGTEEDASIEGYISFVLKILEC